MYHLTNLLLFMSGNGDAQPHEGSGNFFTSPWFMVIIMMSIFYFILILPQQRKMKKDQEMRSQLKEGDKVITNGGIIGTIEKVKDASFIIKTGKNSSMEILKGAVSRQFEKKDDLKGEQQ